MKNKRKKIAVFFGGRSPEHDVSVHTGMEVLTALDSNEYDVIPVYIAPYGAWFTGEALKDKSNYVFTSETEKQLTPVTLDLNASGKAKLLPKKKGFFGKIEPIEFDVAIPTFHGLTGENGSFQGLMEFANIPYTGLRAKACAVFMDKDSTKKALASSGVPMLPYMCLERPRNTLIPDMNDLEKALKKIGLPCIIKPANLGSSIGVGKANDLEDAKAILTALFQLDTKAILEPFVQNLTEYNVALRVNKSGNIETSAIERPKTHEELLNFKEKYMSGKNKKTGQKTNNDGLIALTRDINPDIPEDGDAKIRSWAKTIFEHYDGAGAPRLDFISDGKTGEIWFNEINPIPGSYGYFLWEAAEQNVLYAELLDGMIAEALELHKRSQIPHDPVPKDAQLFKRP